MSPLQQEIPVNTQAIVALVGLGVSFAVMYPWMLTRLSRSVLTPYAKVDVRRRMYAVTIDSLFVVSACALYWPTRSLLLLAAAAAYVAARDAMSGRSIGKFLMGLVVISLESGRPASAIDSLTRNVVFLIPGVNIAAAFLEARTIVRDPQGQRLGDRVALTQVVDGFGAKDLARWFEDTLMDFTGQLGVTTGRRRRAPVRTDRAA